MDGLLTMHRLYQIYTAKSDMDRYPTLYHFRNVDNQQTSLKNSLFQLSKEILKFAGVENSTTGSNFVTMPMLSSYVSGTTTPS